jgi:hypothetical protein
VSQAIAATANVIFDVPTYVGKTTKGQILPGSDVDFLAERLIRYKPATGAGETAVATSPLEAEALASFSRLTSVLRQLLSCPEFDEFGPVRPARGSVDRASHTLFSLVQRGFSLPDAVDIGTDHDGAIRIVWENGPRFLELIVPYELDAAAYFYYSQGDEYNLERGLTPEALRQRFSWLSTGSI